MATRGYGVATGNLSSTFHHAFSGAKEINGSTCAIIETALKDLTNPLCDNLEVVSNIKTKHKMLAERCLGAIVIGGGNGTLAVISEFIHLDKPVIAIEGSGGIVRNELANSVLEVRDSEGAVNKILDLI